ncbi:MAG TPA: PKD domain-containing protein [Flavisolibacter sp.]
MKKIFLLLLICTSLQGFANHLKGGFFTYTYLGPGTTNTDARRYRVTLTVYMECNASGAQINNPITFSFFTGANSNGPAYANPEVSIVNQYNLGKGTDDECITGNQVECYYKIVVYELPSIELPPNAAGYTVAYQRCCRINGIQNISGNSNATGNTYSAFIPGSATLSTYNNSSATFQVNDTVVICRNSFFQYSFLASDINGDSLSYSFCEAFTGGTQNNPAPDPSAPPSTFLPINYATGYSGASPLGPGVTINPRTGLISGIAPEDVGEYVVTVCVGEYRNGVLITTTKKELHIKIGDCNSIAATLDPSYITCDGYNLTFANQTPNGINNYFWDFGVTTIAGDTSNQASPTYPYTDTGTYTVTLIVNRGGACTDTARAIAKVYPGFFPGFTHAGVCINKPTQFTDTTRTNYGFVNTWRWDFGDTGNADTSRIQNPQYTYTTAGTKTVTFIVSNSKGCIDTIDKQIEILTKPPLSVTFKDTLICNGDSVQLGAIGTGIFTWTPVTNIINETTADPTVFPQITTNYFVQLNDQGCLATDTVKVRVVDYVTLRAMNDTLICVGDTMRLRATTDGLYYLWTNPATLNDPTLLMPTAQPIDNPTEYIITSRIGLRCFATDTVLVSLTPYSTVRAGRDTTICYNTTAQLGGTTDGTLLNWTPTTGLNDPSSLSPQATLRTTTTYVLSTVNMAGCISRDTVTVEVNPEVIAFAGRDTAVVVNQVLQFNATGGVTYQWTPGTALNSTTISNPRAVYNGSFDSIRYHLEVADSIGCTDDATVLVKIFRTNPRVFVPTAFTPNGDGRNEIVAPIAVGLTKLDYFRIFNRWGQLVFETTINGKGWDGKIGGKEQSTATYVWIVKGTDYTGKQVFEKGNVTLIR